MEKSENIDIDKMLKALTMGLAQGSTGQIYRNHRDLYHLGSIVIPTLRERILSQSWNDIKYTEQLNILTGLLSLVNDIDEDQAKEVADKIRQQGCSKMVESRLISVTDFTLKEFELRKLDGVSVYIWKTLKNKNKIQRLTTEWLSLVPANDLTEVERIYIIPETEESH